MSRRWIPLAVAAGLVVITGAVGGAWQKACGPRHAVPWGGSAEERAGRWLAYSEDLTVLRVLRVQPPGFSPQLLFLTVEELYPRRSLEERGKPANSFARGGPAHITTFPRHPLRSRLYLVDPDDPFHPRLLAPASSYNFWEVSQGDVDGDGVQEIGLCTWSRTVQDSRMNYRFFVYGWTADGDLEPRFRGSRLSRALVAAMLRDVKGDGRAELLSVEKAVDGGQVVVAYAWNQFGFRGIGESEVYPEVCLAGAPPRSRDDSRSFPVYIAGEHDRWRGAWMRWEAGKIATVEAGKG